MIKVGKVCYYIDLSAIDKVTDADKEEFKAGVITTTETVEIFDEEGNVASKQVHTRVENKPRELNMTKYEQINSMLQVLMGPPDEELDESMGAERALSKQSFAFKTAFNTLQFYGILKELD